MKDKLTSEKLMKDWEAFRHVKKVEAPPFLLGKIEMRIRKAETQRIPARLVWTGVLALLLLLAADFAAIRKSRASGNVSTDGEYAFTVNHELYHE